MSAIPCPHPGCPRTHTCREAASRHAAEEHVPCTCGRHFTRRGLIAHLAQTKRRGNRHPLFPGWIARQRTRPARRSGIPSNTMLTVRHATKILIEEAAKAVAGAGQGIREPVSEERRARVARAVARLWTRAHDFDPDASSFANLGLPFPDDAPEVRA